MKPRQKTISKPASLKLHDLSNYPFMNLSLEDMEGEEWIDIPKGDGYYQISNYARIKALSRPRHTLIKGHLIISYTKERILSQSLKSTYNEHVGKYFFSLQVIWQYEKIVYRSMVHRLMYECFVGDINDELRIIHKDGDNLNNVIENLEVSTGTTIFYKSLNNNSRPSKPKPLEKTHNQISILQFDLQGNLIHQFPSITDAAKAINTDYHAIRKVLNHQMKHRKGFVFRYENDTYDGEYANLSNAKKVSQYTVDGKLIIVYDSVAHAYRETGIYKDEISRSALLKKKFAGGFVWRYENDHYEGDYTPIKRNLTVCQYHIDGRFIQEFANRKEAAKSTNLKETSIRSCLKGGSKTLGGFVWRYKDQPYHGEHQKISHKGTIAVNQLDVAGNVVAKFRTIQDASLVAGISAWMLRHFLKKATKFARNGFFWVIVPPDEKEIIPSNISFKRVSKNSIKVCQYTKEGEKIATYNSISEASLITGIKTGIISYFFNRPFHVSGDFIWRKEGDEYHGELKDTLQVNERKIITQYDLQGNKLKVYSSINEAKKNFKSNHSAIDAVLSGKRRNANGFIWRYGDGPAKIEVIGKNLYTRSKTVSCYDFEGNKKGYYKSMREAAKVHKRTCVGIINAVNGKAKSASELIWILGDGPDKIDSNVYFLKGEVKAISKS